MRRVLIVVLLVALAGCAPAEDEAADVVTEVVTEVDKVAALIEERDDAEAELERLEERAEFRREAAAEAAAAAQPSPTPNADATGEFGGTSTYPDGVAVSLAVPTPYTPSENSFDPRDAAAYVAIDVTVTNGGTENYDPATLFLTAQSGDEPAEQVIDVRQDITGAPQTTVLPGRSVTFPVVFGVADPSDLVVEVTPGFDYESAIFTGGVGDAAEPTEEATVSSAAPEPAPVVEEPYDYQCADGTWQPDASGCPAAEPQEGVDYEDSYPDGPDDGTGVICTSDGSYQVSPADCPTP